MGDLVVVRGNLSYAKGLRDLYFLLRRPSASPRKFQNHREDLGTVVAYHAHSCGGKVLDFHEGAQAAQRRATE